MKNNKNIKLKRNKYNSQNAKVSSNTKHKKKSTTIKGKKTLCIQYNTTIHKKRINTNLINTTEIKQSTQCYFNSKKKKKNEMQTYIYLQFR